MTAPRPEQLLEEADVLAALRAADPAAAGGTHQTGRVGRELDQRARADLETILSESPAAALVRRPAVVGRRRRRILFAAVPVAATAAAASVALMIGLEPSSPALASWQPVPATAPGAAVSDEDITAWTSECTDLTGTGVGIQGAEVPSASAPRQVLVDRRGDLTYCVDYHRGSGRDTDPTVLLSGLKGPGVQQGTSTVLGSGSPAMAAPRGGDVVVVGGDSTVDPPREVDGSVADRSEEFYTLNGLAGPDVVGLDVELTNGLRVTATLVDGLWGLWWPTTEGDVIGARLVVHDAAGERVVEADDVALRFG